MTEEQRRALQRERELAARARLKAFVASDAFDGRATVDFYGFGKILGTGSFGEVRLAWHRLAGVKVAIKSYEKSRITDPSQWKRVQQEVEVLARLNHLHGLRMFETIDTPKRIHIVTEYCAGGNLCTYVKGRGRLAEAEARRIFGQLVANIEYLHAQGIIHRDIKLENVLFADEKRDVVKLVDFGFAVVVPDPWRRLRIFCGTPSYMAPEICQRREYYGRPVDVWSLGVLLYAMVVGRFPFSGKTYPDLYKRIVAGQLAFPDHVSNSARDLLRRMLTVDATRRLSLANVATHPWVTVGLPAPTAAAVAAAQSLYGTVPSSAGMGGIMQASNGLISSLPPLQAPDKALLVSADPANDINEAVLQRCEHLGYKRAQMIAAILARERNACTTTYYLLLTRLGRAARVAPAAPAQAAPQVGGGGAGAYGSSSSSSSGGAAYALPAAALQRPQSSHAGLAGGGTRGRSGYGHGGGAGGGDDGDGGAGSYDDGTAAAAGAGAGDAAGGGRAYGSGAGGGGGGQARPMSAAPAPRRAGLQAQAQQAAAMQGHGHGHGFPMPFHGGGGGGGRGDLTLATGEDGSGHGGGGAGGAGGGGGEDGTEYGSVPLPSLGSPAGTPGRGGLGRSASGRGLSSAASGSGSGSGSSRALLSSRGGAGGYDGGAGAGAGGGGAGGDDGIGNGDGDLGAQHGGYEAGGEGGDDGGYDTTPAAMAAAAAEREGLGYGMAGAMARRPASAGPVPARRRM